MAQPQNASGSQRRAAEEHGGAPILQWIVAAIGLVLVLGSILFIGYHAIVRQPGPADVQVQVRDVRPAKAGFVVVIEAFNHGQETAANVIVKGELKGSGQSVVETSETELDFVPSESSRRGGLFFRNDPRTHSMEIRATGYQKP